MLTRTDRIAGGLWGLLVGDALGALAAEPARLSR